MVLKAVDTSAVCNYGIELRDQNNNIINLDKTRADIGSQYVGSVLRVRIFEIGGSPANSCWGYVNVEDKLPPDIVCVGNDTLQCHLPDPFETDESAEAYLESQIESKLIDNCGNEEVEVDITRNDLVQMLCQDTFSAMRIVGYNALDNNFNVTSCEDTIYYVRYPLEEIDAPKNYVENMSLDCNDPYPTIEYLLSMDSESSGNNSLPNINGRSIFDYIDSSFVERGLCNLKATSTDIKFETCGTTFKIVRVWTIIDWCYPHFPITFNQIIKVVDDNINLSPISNLGPFAADAGLCDTNVELPFPQVSSNECSDWKFSIFVKEPSDDFFYPYGGERSSTEITISRRFPIGTSIVKYIAEDECGNTDEEEFEVTVEDQEEPIPVCDYRTVVTLNDNFLGKVQAESFDDGSFDYCSGIVSYQVRRVDRFETPCETPLDFDGYVKFCCADIGKTIMVELEVTDGVGLTARCMTEAVVQYKGPGPSVSCPPNIGVQPCTDFESFDINSLAVPSVSSSNPCIADNLTPFIRETGRSIDECGDGYIDVEWYYNITGEEEVICSYRIDFGNPDPFGLSDINWPDDRTVNSCDEAPPTAEELANIINSTKPCTKAVVSDPVDLIFDNVPGRCLKIVRTWTVVDWCRYPANPSARWTHEQTIEIVNSAAPVIDVSGVNLTIDNQQENCRAIVNVSGLATDDCTPVDELSWSYMLNLIQDGSEIPLIPETQGQTLERVLAAGSYIITWSSTDGCGNTAVNRQPFTIADDLVPNAFCNSIVRDIDNLGRVIVSASELDGGSSDNCGNNFTLRIKRPSDPNPPSDTISFSCEDIGLNNIELWVTDQMGNQSSCIAQVDIRDGLSTCGFGASNLVISGNIKTPEQISVEDASVHLMTNDAMVQSITTPVDGSYQFEELSNEENYSLDISKNQNYLNGISTLDLVLMQRHILGLQELNSPYKLIAADINNNGQISAVDIVILRRLILGHIDEFPDNDSWKFIAQDYEFSDPQDPWQLPAYVELGNLDESMTKEIVAVKIGDLNSNVVANSQIAHERTQKALGFYKNVILRGQETVVQYLASEDLEYFGFQAVMDYDPQYNVIVDIRSRHFEIVEGMTNNVDGLLKVSIAHAEVRTISKDEVVFEVVLNDLRQDQDRGDLLNITSSTDYSSEIYTKDLEVLRLFEDTDASSDELVLYQNKPNPFDQTTFVEFYIPKKSAVSFELFDINGLRVYSNNRTFEGGRNVIEVDRERMQLNKGIYYYQIRAQDRSLTRKMIIL